MDHDHLTSYVDEAFTLDRIISDHPNCVVFYCAYGERSALALGTVREAGHTGLRHLAGGMAEWLKNDGEVVFN